MRISSVTTSSVAPRPVLQPLHAAILTSIAIYKQLLQHLPVTFIINITLSSTRTDPYTAFIAYGTPSLPLPNTIVTVLAFPNDTIAEKETSPQAAERASFTRFTAQTTPPANTSLRLGHLCHDRRARISPGHREGQYITRCSGNGKGALVSKIALKIPQE